MIIAYVGMPGDGKTYMMTAWMIKQMGKGRLGYSQYAVDGARRLQYLHDLFHDAAIGACVAIDEVGRLLPARDWMREDDVEMALLETHRHRGLDIAYACQNPAQVSTSIRRLTERWIYCFRCGKDPSNLIKKGIRPHWWQMPIAIRTVTYAGGQSTDGLPDTGSYTHPVHGRLNKGEVHYHWFHRHIALAYDTTERVYSEGLDREIRERVKTSEERLLQTSPWKVVNGKAEGSYTRLQRARDDEEIRRRQQRRNRNRPAPAEAPVQEWSAQEESEAYSALSGYNGTAPE